MQDFTTMLGGAHSVDGRSSQERGGVAARNPLDYMDKRARCLLGLKMVRDVAWDAQISLVHDEFRRYLNYIPSLILDTEYWL